METCHRHLTVSLLDALADTPAVLVNGASQAGKNTLVQSPEVASQDRQYLTFGGVISRGAKTPSMRSPRLISLRMSVSVNESDSA